MTDKGSFRPPKQWQLTENETITSFANWQSNIMYHLSLNNEFEPFLTSVWQKKSVPNRGLTASTTKTAVQLNIVLERMVGLIAQFVPTLLRNDILKKSTSLNYIWQRIRKHYSFSQSEVNFLKLSSIKREDHERYETFFQRIVAHLEDNLLTVASGIIHDGAPVADDEEMSPTTERLAVYLWLSLIDDRLPAYIARVYAHDLQTKSLKEIQPLLADSMDSLLAELSAQEEISINYSSSRKYQFRDNKYKRGKATPPSQRNSTSSQKSCILCKTAGRNYQGHDITDCWFISKFEKLQIAKALQVEVDDIETDQVLDDSPVNAKQVVTEHTPTTNIQKVQCDMSPYFYAFYEHHPVNIVLDTGATSSLISKSFVKSAGIQIKPTKHSARSVDKTSLHIHGEVHITLNFSSISLPLTALVVDSLDCDVLAGVPFCKHNDIHVHLKDEKISIGDSKVPYGCKPKTLCHDIFRTESLILRNDSAKVILPGEFLEFSSDSLKEFDGEVAIEPHQSSPMQGSWPSPEISRVISGTIRIANSTDDPIPLSRSQHFAQIRRVISPDHTIPLQHPKLGDPIYEHLPKTSKHINFSDAATVDPDSQLSTHDRNRFHTLHRHFDSVFNPTFGAYNDFSGTIRAKVNIGSVMPTPRKGQLPLYKQSNLQLLQEEADKLEELGVLAKPEDVGVDVVYTSPSFLVKKPQGGYRLVTAFNDLGRYTRILPSASTSCNDVLRRLSSWKYLIKSDLTKSFFQIPVAKSSMQYLGTVTPFKGLRVYTRSAMGMPGSSEYLQELLSRVFGDFLQEGFIILIADDIHVCGNTVDELLTNWSRVLHRLQKNNLNLSASKTVVCPIQTTILGWQWKQGTLTPCDHKVSPLAKVSPPRTCTAMRSFIGAFKALSKCIPHYASLVAPLENSIKGLQGQQLIQWNDDLHTQFSRCQTALKSAETITIPRPDDKLIVTVDASPVNQGLGATLFVVRDSKRLVGGFFSFKLKSHQINWLPCEHEALAISAAINFFAPYIRESKHKTQVLSDSKPCVQAYEKLCKGQFSASNRVSTFLSTLSSFNVTLCHLKGSSNQSSDFASRHPNVCTDQSCQVCVFVQSTTESVVNAITVDDVLSGTTRMPFINQSAWHSAQQDCPNLRRTFAHLSKGTRPPRKAKNMKAVRRYLKTVTIAENGLLIVLKSDPYVHQRKLIVVPESILQGLLTAIHLQFNHPSTHQLQKVFDRYFYALNSASFIRSIADQCSICKSLKHIPTELHEQSSSSSPSCPGQEFSSDVLRRTKQKIFVTRDTFSSFTTASIIHDETADNLRSALISTTSFLRMPSTTVRVDGATGFNALKEDNILQKNGIHLDFGRLKNKNKNPVIDKAIQELEQELLRSESDKPLTQLTLDTALHTLNSRIRYQGLSAKEIILQRDQQSGSFLNINDTKLSHSQEQRRQQNHPHSSKSKARGGKPALPAKADIGDLVFIKQEGTKTKSREQYIIIRIENNDIILQKMNNGKFMSRQYRVPLTDVILATPEKDNTFFDWDNTPPHQSSESVTSDTNSSTYSSDDSVSSNEHSVSDEDTNSSSSHRIRRRPRYLDDYEL